jgi:glycosyltransferase involved in cell wall biosynthesis
MIVLNGEPFVRYNLRALYPFAHRIIVVEGASPSAAGIATPDGHSTDGTLETLKRFRENEDPEGKVVLVTAEDEGHPDGFWPGEKDEQSRAYALRAMGDYLWQVDVDEFYLPRDMVKTIALVSANDGDVAVSFKMITFWGGLGYLTDGWYLRRGAAIYHRLFRWREGYRYATHRPPTVVNDKGVDLRMVRYLDGKALFQDHGIRLYHYSLLFPKQVREKCLYYAHAYPRERREAERWAVENFEKLSDPYRVHNVYLEPSWLERFPGEHPPQVLRMMEDIRKGEVRVERRCNEDVEEILDSLKYRVGRGLLKAMARFHTMGLRGKSLVRRVLGRISPS